MSADFYDIFTGVAFGRLKPREDNFINAVTGGRIMDGAKMGFVSYEFLCRLPCGCAEQFLRNR